MIIKKFCIGLLGLFVAHTALAATAIKAPGNLWIVDNCGSTCWSGLYIGGQAGKSWNHMTYQYQNANYFNSLGPILLGNSFDFTDNAGVGGVTLGVNYQEWTWVFGVEANVLYGNIKEKETSPFFTVDEYTSKLRYMTLAKVRWGYAYDRFLFSLTGGWAGGDLSIRLQDNQFGVLGKTHGWSQGWTAGAAIDFMFARHLSFGIAYDFFRIRLNEQKVNCPACGTGVGFGEPIVNARDKTQTIMARLNYYFYQY